MTIMSKTVISYYVLNFYYSFMIQVTMSSMSFIWNTEITEVRILCVY